MKRWRKQPNEIGLSRVFQSPRGYDLTENGETLIVVRPIQVGWGHDYDGWWWYSYGLNTRRTPFKTKDEAKQDAIKWMKDNKIK